ncbi:MAG: urease accessory protein UreD [Aromatoleum sp.]|jgi:urease accessory protein|uniref:urease accessory protein UreD n=1 Tax=Aromatoleum sp. TaxID=2307007 RepID=UPI00289462EC|nr:urease accessory protein UreD [Aromatoleum sp.]MDT3669431.1 urease accessory protein UreD [Aromatoleum sp.]
MNAPAPIVAAQGVVPAPWRASLTLRFADRDGRTALVERRHFGPLMVQKPLYPEGKVCHVVMLHPPGGIAGGDELAIDIEVGPGAHATLTTPGANRWYKSLGRDASQHVRLAVGPGACLDWLPQENIVFRQARPLLDTRLTVAAGGSAIGWDAFVLGRGAAGEYWSEGRLRLRTEVQYAGRMLWIEAAELQADSPLRAAPVGMDGFDVFGTLWAVGAAASPALAEQIAAMLPCHATLRAGLSCLGPTGEGMLLLRVLGTRIEAVRQLLETVWTALRQPIHRVPAKPLRLWAT